ncbi:MAG: hypothetical protein JWO38_5943 [Gemmataceae bacterium]|nr:hypothetical protein [Gemmataceae bacterium]
MDRARDLHDRYMGGPVPKDADRIRFAELRLLARCLEGNAAVRLALGEGPDSEDHKLVAEVRLQDRWA